MSASSVLKSNSHNANKKSAVYYYYRDMLENYNHKANKILENLPTTTLIREDKGINDKIETILQKSKGNEWIPKISSETKEHNGNEMKNVPPRCIQNAMLTKDKKPFTYTPGGINLSEIRSPNMARRLELNSQSEGIASARDMRNEVMKNSANVLPPAALAAMQPALPVQVLPKIISKKEQLSPLKNDNTQSSYFSNAVKIKHQPQTAPPPPPPPPPFPISQQNFFTETNVPSKLVSSKSEISQQNEKPLIQKNVRFESDRNINQKESNIESKKCGIPQISSSNSFSSPILFNLNKSPTPWVPRKYNDFRETIVPDRTEQKNIEEDTILTPSMNNGKKEEVKHEKSEKNEHIIPVKIEEYSNNVNCNFKAGRNNLNYEKMDQISKTSNRIIPIEVEDSFRKQPLSPQVSPNGISSARYKIHSVNPIQSRSFRILQKMTDSYEDVNNNNNNNDISSCNVKNIAQSNTFENQRRSNTHSPALDMYEDKIRSQQQMSYGKAYKILQHGDDICDTYDRKKLDVILKNGQFNNLTTKTTTKENDKNRNYLALSVISLKSKQNDDQAINVNHSDSNCTNCPNADELGVSETKAEKYINMNAKSNENFVKKPRKKYEGGKTHSRLLHLIA